MASVFSACGNKGYLLAKDENGIEHAYVTDENGSTVLNENGDVRVYVTDKDGKIVKDTSGKPMESGIKKPEYTATDSKYETSDILLNITDGWKNATKGKYIKGENTECYMEISKSNNAIEGGDEALENSLKEEIELNKQLMDNIILKYPESFFKNGYKEVCGRNMYVYEYKIVDENKSVIYYCIMLYFTVDNSIYSISYTDNDGKEYDPEYSFISYIEKNLTIK